MLMYGPSGSGKKTRMMAILKELYGQSVEKVCMEYVELYIAFLVFKLAPFDDFS